MKESDLQQFTGTTRYFKHWLGFNYTEGVHYLETHGAGWFLDAIGSYQHELNSPFQVWTLKVKDKSAVLTMQEDSDKPILIKQEIYTDFPLASIELWLIDGVLILPSEY